IAQLKFKGDYFLGRSLARLILGQWLAAYRALKVVKPTVVIPVPLTRWRLWRRGFNQAQALSQPLAHWLACQHQPFAIQRLAGRAAQKSLSARERQKNLQGAFSCQQRFDGLIIALVDDIVTTGSTVNEISCLLKAQGAKSIQVLCVCRN